MFGARPGFAIEPIGCCGSAARVSHSPMKEVHSMPTLTDPITIGAIHAPNRILMAPLTRARNTREHVPTPMMM